MLGIAGAIAILAINHREKWPTITIADLDAAAVRWSANGPADYDMDLVLAGMTHGTAHVEVRAGSVSKMLLNDHLTKEHTWENWSVPGLLSIIRRDLESCLVPKAGSGGTPGATAGLPSSEDNSVSNAKPESAQPVYPHGTFDAHYGYPAQYHRITPTGADAQWEVTKFEQK